MSFNPEKMAALILNECQSIENKCAGYREKILDAVIKILTAEKEHQAQRTQIQQQVNTACHAVGDFLARNRDTGISREGTTQ